MASDDYFVVLFKLLTRLFELMQQGKTMTAKDLEEFNGGKLNDDYWAFILLNAAKDGYIEGIKPVKSLGLSRYKASEVQITGKGIEYLMNEPKISKIKRKLALAPGWSSLIRKLWPK